MQQASYPNRYVLGRRADGQWRSQCTDVAFGENPRSGLIRTRALASVAVIVGQRQAVHFSNNVACEGVLRAELLASWSSICLHFVDRRGSHRSAACVFGINRLLSFSYKARRLQKRLLRLSEIHQINAPIARDLVLVGRSLAVVVRQIPRIIFQRMCVCVCDCEDFFF